MDVSYVEPLQRAWARSRRMLFQPFDIGKWFVLGFAAFLSEALVSGHGSNYSAREDGAGRSELADLMGGAFAPAVWTALGMLLIAAVVVLLLVFLWVNSRGRFIFLDDVVRERAAIVEPWKQFKRLGNSLFVWMILFLLVCAAVYAIMILPFIASLAAVGAAEEFTWGLLGGLWLFAAFAVPFTILVAYVVLFLSDFVIPIMYRHGLGAAEAWGRFLALLRAHPGAFLLYGLFVFGLWFGAVLAVAAVGIATCCIGFVLFALPYLGSVVLLPVLVTFRGLGPEFLAQFGPEFALWAPAAAPPVVAPAAPEGAA